MACPLRCIRENPLAPWSPVLWAWLLASVGVFLLFYVVRQLTFLPYGLLLGIGWGGAIMIGEGLIALSKALAQAHWIPRTPYTILVIHVGVVGWVSVGSCMLACDARRWVYLALAAPVLYHGAGFLYAWHYAMI